MPPDKSARSPGARRARGLWRLSVWLPEEYHARLDALCRESGMSRPEQVAALVDAEQRELDEIRRGK